jgi:acyl-CoA dehydrogenase
MFWFLTAVAVALYCAYRRFNLRTNTLAGGLWLAAYAVFGGSFGLFVLLLALYAVVFGTLNWTAFRQEWVSRPAMKWLRGVLPEMSETERAAAAAGSVGWEGQLFTGAPPLADLLAQPAPRLTEEEQAFLDGPVDELCAMLDEWRITTEDRDLTPETWAFLKKHRFFGMVIPKEYGGLGFSAFAHSQVLVKVSSAPAGITAGSIVAVPNSLGPAELLLHYGTEAQQQQYLPRLARGEDIPCFALTSPWAGSDAASIPDIGVVCEGDWRGERVLGMRLSFDKRYITLAPVATLIGLAFRLRDPDGLLGDNPEPGLTCALIPRDTPGLEIGERHWPIESPFMNGPIRGEDLFVPLDCIIGGPKMAGHGWRMLVECLAVGRSISLPSNATGGTLMAAYATGAYARIRRQFGLPIGEFEGIQLALAGMGGRAYASDALRRATAAAVDRGERPSVPSAIAKSACTEMSRETAILGMDVQAGKAVMMGPKNLLARFYGGAPVGITVEGANILTRSLIIFGQGAFRCHPFVPREMEALADDNAARALESFDDALIGHLGHTLSAAARALVLGLSSGRIAGVPLTGATRRPAQKLLRYSAAFALLADAAMAVYGGKLKFKEGQSARLGEILAQLYILSSMIKRYEDDGAIAEDAVYLEWACAQACARIEQEMHVVLGEMPMRPMVWLIRALIFPLGRRARMPSDAQSAAVAQAMQTPSPAREAVFSPVYAPRDGDLPIAEFNRALEAAVATEPLLKRVLKAARSGLLRNPHPLQRIDEALEKDVLDAEEAEQLRAAMLLAKSVCDVDAFAIDDMRSPRDATQIAAKKAATKRPRSTARKASSDKT